MEPRRVHEVVHTLRQKPVHVRQNIALGIAAGITLLVTVGWVATGTVNGALTLDNNNSVTTLAAEDAKAIQEATAAGKSGFTQLLGAAGAAVGATSTPTTITIVDTEVHSTLDQDEIDPNATVIHF